MSLGTRRQQDVVFLDVPWGGPDYVEAGRVGFCDALGDVPLVDVVLRPSPARVGRGAAAADEGHASTSTPSPRRRSSPTAQPRNGRGSQRCRGSASDHDAPRAPRASRSDARPASEDGLPDLSTRPMATAHARAEARALSKLVRAARVRDLGGENRWRERGARGSPAHAGRRSPARPAASRSSARRRRTVDAVCEPDALSCSQLRLRLRTSQGPPIPSWRISQA